MTPRSETDPELELQRAELAASFRLRQEQPDEAAKPRVLTEHNYAEALRILGRIGQGGSTHLLTHLDPATIQAVRDGAQPGDSLPPLQPDSFMDRVTDAEVIITGCGSRHRVAVLFSHEDFPGRHFGHRFPLPSEELAEYAATWLEEAMDTGALHRMMQSEPAVDDAGIIWTTWGS